jgi:multimeric flavodoxin WrbA
MWRAGTIMRCRKRKELMRIDKKEGETMKIVSIIGSPKGVEGNTGALLKIVLEGAKGKGAETEIIAIKGQEVKPCKGCDTCHKKGSCPQKDDYAMIKEKVMKADGLILATPNYISNVSAQMKAFLDRCCGVVHCQDFQGKYGASVVSSGGGDEKTIADYLQHFLAVTGGVPVGSVWATMGQIEGRSFPEDLRNKAFTLGEKVVSAWKNKEASREYEKVTAQFRERMRSLITWRKHEWPFEYDFWRECRGLDDTST